MRKLLQVKIDDSILPSNPKRLQDACTKYEAGKHKKRKIESSLVSLIRAYSQEKHSIYSHKNQAYKLLLKYKKNNTKNIVKRKNYSQFKEFVGKILKNDYSSAKKFLGGLEKFLSVKLSSSSESTSSSELSELMLDEATQRSILDSIRNGERGRTRSSNRA